MLSVHKNYVKFSGFFTNPPNEIAPLCSAYLFYEADNHNVLIFLGGVLHPHV